MGKVSLCGAQTAASKHLLNYHQGSTSPQQADCRAVAQQIQRYRFLDAGLIRQRCDDLLPLWGFTLRSVAC